MLVRSVGIFHKHLLILFAITLPWYVKTRLIARLLNFLPPYNRSIYKYFLRVNPYETRRKYFYPKNGLFTSNNWHFSIKKINGFCNG